VKSFLHCALCCSTAFVASAAAASDPVPVFQCVLSAPLPDGGPRLLVLKSFRENGDVNSMHVSWEDNAASGLVRPPNQGDRIFVSLRWPGEHRSGRPDDPFDWSQGSITMHLLLADAAANFSVRTGEEWRQVLVDRNHSVSRISEGGEAFADPSVLDMLVMSDLEPTTSPGRMSMSLNSFLAWGSGVQYLTVYETRVKRRTPPKNSYPTSSAGAHRIIGAYDVDMAALAHTVAMIRAATEQWESTLSTSWRNCRRTTEGGDITVADPRIRLP
jgi:hypothetical protein